MNKIAQYRKRPVVIEAVQWDGTASGATPIIDWVLKHGGTATYREELPLLRAPSGEVAQNAEPTQIRVTTLEGAMAARPGWWVIRGVHGEFYPCEPAVFAKTYDAVPA